MKRRALWTVKEPEVVCGQRQRSASGRHVWVCVRVNCDGGHYFKAAA